LSDDADVSEALVADLTGKADMCVASGDVAGAAEWLIKAAQVGPAEPSLFLKLAGLQRVSGQLDSALASVHQALALAPRDFTALLLRGSLLQRLGDAAAGEAWAHALAQRPEGEIPRHLAGVVAEAERHAHAWLEQREQRMAAAIASTIPQADADEAARIQRFRSNVLRRTRHYHSEPTNFHFPGLREYEFHPRKSFDWLTRLEAETETIAAEFESVMASERAQLVPYVQYADHVPMEQWRPLNRSPDWTAIHLLRNGCEVSVNAKHCRKTLALLATIAQPRIPGASPNAMFSLLAPGTSIPPHVGINNARLVCHLPLLVPEGCWFRVGAETRHWRRGEAFVFDDTIEHEALNPTAHLRVVLIFDVWHPDLSAIERRAVAETIAADMTPS
jgi:hypothetical protein